MGKRIWQMALPIGLLALALPMTARGAMKNRGISDPETMVVFCVGLACLLIGSRNPVKGK
jgi:hypothetical protein